MARVEVREQAVELLDLAFQLRVAGLRLLGDALEPALDVVAVGDEQLELQRLEIVRGHAGAGEAVEHDEQRVDLAQVPQQPWAPSAGEAAAVFRPGGGGFAAAASSPAAHLD